MARAAEMGGMNSWTRTDLLKETPVRIMRAFMDSVEAKNGIVHVDYEINAALKNQQYEIATVIDDLLFEGGDRQPFVCMLSRAAPG